MNYWHNLSATVSQRVETRTASCFSLYPTDKQTKLKHRVMILMVQTFGSVSRSEIYWQNFLIRSILCCAPPQSEPLLRYLWHRFHWSMSCTVSTAWVGGGGEGEFLQGDFFLNLEVTDCKAGRGSGVASDTPWDYIHRLILVPALEFFINARRSG